MFSIYKYTQKWLIPWLGQRKYKVLFEHPSVPRCKKVFKTTDEIDKQQGPAV